MCVSVLDMYRSGMGMMDRDFGRSDMGMNRPFGDSFGGLGRYLSINTHTYTHVLYVFPCIFPFLLLPVLSLRRRDGRIWRRNGELWHGSDGLWIRYACSDQLFHTLGSVQFIHECFS